MTLIICLCLFAIGRASAQWAVIDPSNIAQSIVNTSKNVVHTSTTAQNMIKNFQETVKIYEQGKKYYDALKSVNNLVKDARKVQQTILMVGDITDTYVTSFQKMMRDDNFTVEELGAIAFGYTKLLEESNDVLQAAIDEKNTAVQNALKVENEKKAAIAEAEKVVAAAKGKADANRILQQSITPELIQLKAVEKWDGKLPLSTGGNTLPFLKLQ